MKAIIRRRSFLFLAFIHMACLSGMPSLSAGQTILAPGAAPGGDQSATLLPPALADTDKATTDGGSKTDQDEVSSVADMFSKGKFSGNIRTFYYSLRSAYFVSGLNQDTVSYGGNIAYTSARLMGFRLGGSAYLQRGIAHSSNPNDIDIYLGPNLTSIGEAYLEWGHGAFDMKAGNQMLDMPFISSYDWRIVPQLFQGVTAKYGDDTSYVTAARITKYKSYIDGSFSRLTNYSLVSDPYAAIGNTESSGVWALGAAYQVNLKSVVFNGQAWYQAYADYANLTYLEGRATWSQPDWKPFIGVQYFHENGNGKKLLGEVQSNVIGTQLGASRDSLKMSVGYDYIVPNRNSYLNGALVTPYAHNVASGPMFAQPYMTATQDLGAGRAYALDISGSPSASLSIGARYSFLDLKPVASSPSISQSEYLIYAVYSPTGRLKGLSIGNFFAIQTQPGKSNFIQNRLQLQYTWG